MKTFQEYLKEAGFREGSDAIIFKGKEIDTDTIEYDMQDYSDMIFELEIGVKYTDGTEVEDGDMDELQELPEIVDWVSDDYNDRMADKADAYRDAVKHGDFESTQPDINEAVDKSELEAWYNKYSKYRGNNGDELPAGMLRGYIDTGIMTDGVEDNELEKAVKMLGGDRSKAEDELFNDDDGIFAKMLPITDAMQKEFLKIMGVSEIDEENCTEAAKILGDDIVGFGVDEGTQELDRIKELAGASIDETYDDDDDFYEAYGEMWWNEDDDPIDEAEYQGRKVKLGKPMAGDVKKFKVYVKDPKTGNVKKVNFGHGGSSVKGKSMRIRKNNPGARKSFRARHNCDNPGPRTKARYWSCRKW